MSVRSEHRALERARSAEAVRQAIRHALEQLPQRLLAPMIGINRGSLRKVLAMSRPRRDTRAQLKHWFLDRPEPDLHPGVIGLALLAEQFPFAHRQAARRQLTIKLLSLYDEAGEQPPPWLVDERRAFRGSGAGRGR